MKFVKKGLKASCCDLALIAQHNRRLFKSFHLVGFVVSTIDVDLMYTVIACSSSEKFLLKVLTGSGGKNAKVAVK